MAISFDIQIAYIGYGPGDPCAAGSGVTIAIGPENIVTTNPIVKWTYTGSGFTANPLVVFLPDPQWWVIGSQLDPTIGGCAFFDVTAEDSLGNTHTESSSVSEQAYIPFTGTRSNTTALGSIKIIGKDNDLSDCVPGEGPCFWLEDTDPYAYAYSGGEFVTRASPVVGGMKLVTTFTAADVIDAGSEFVLIGYTTSTDAAYPAVLPSDTSYLVAGPLEAYDLTAISTSTAFTPSVPLPTPNQSWVNDSALAAGDVVRFSVIIPTDYPLHVVDVGVYELAREITVRAGALPPASVLTPTCLPGAVLGVGDDIQVLLLTRGGGSVIAELNPVSGSFTRDVDATSTLEMTGVTSGFLGESCCDNWDEVYPWNTEIIVYRDGRDAWCGPVTGVEFGYGTVKVTAADLTAWWDRRVLPADLNFVNVDISTIFETVATAAMSTDPVANFNITTTLTGILGTRTYLQTDYKYANDLLGELAKTGIDYSAYGRTILCGGEQVPADPYVVLTDEFWVQPPTISARGNDQATQVIVLGKGVTGVATATTAYTDFYGLLVRTFSENEIEDAVSAQAAANTRLALLQDQLYIEAGTGGGLKPTAPITLPELIPGIRVRVDSSASCRQVVADFRLKSVKVGFDGSVSIDLQPLGTIGT